MRLNATAVSFLSMLVFSLGLISPHRTISSDTSFNSLSPRIQSQAIAPEAESALSNGVPYNTSLGPVTYSNVYIDVPNGATRLTITVSNGSGDLDLYVKYGAPLQGNTVAELDADTDFISDGPTASEQVVVTPSDKPPLQQGKWYIAVLNYNSYTTTFTITASYAAFGITSETDPSVLIPGTTFDWSYQITPGTNSSESVDMVAAVMLPNQSLLFFTDQGITNQFQPYQRDFEVDQSGSSGFVLAGLSFPAGLPEGYYNFYTLLVRSGNIISDSNNWLSKPAVSQVYYSALSPAQQGLIAESGYPNRFIKSFSEGYGRKRVDETWTYAAEGKIRSFINGEYAGQEDAPLDAAAPQNSARPQDYTFATTPAAVTSKHGQPAVVQTKTVWSGTFNHYIYDSLAFGFLNNTLVSVISVGSLSTSKSPQLQQAAMVDMIEMYDSKISPYQLIDALKKPMRRFETGGTKEVEILSNALETRQATIAATAETVNIGVLFTYASLLGLAAQQGIEGAQSAWDSCMAGISSTAPTGTNLDCFKNALSTLSVQSAASVLNPGGFWDFLPDWFPSLRADAQSNESTAGEPYVKGPGQYPGQKGYVALSVSPREAGYLGQVHFTCYVYEKNLQSVTISGPNVSDRMSKTGEGVFGYDWQVPHSTEDSLSFKATAHYQYGYDLGATTVLNLIAQLRVKLSPKNRTTSVDFPVRFTASSSYGKPPLYYIWHLGGETRSIGPWYGPNSQDRIFDKPGTYNIDVKVMEDDSIQNDTDSTTITVYSNPLLAAFTAQPSSMTAGEGGQFCVSAGGGWPPYSYNFTSSDGFGQDGSNACATITFSTPGFKTVTVTVKDAGADQSTTIGCQVFVEAPPCVPPNCCSENPQVCGPNCIPAGADCCNPGTGGWCATECCGAGCCEPDWYCCPDQAGCCKNGDVCCQGGGCCPAEAPQCCYPGCCPEESKCCGSGCCPSGYFCCPDKSGCCPDGYECIEGGKCVQGTGNAIFRLFWANHGE